MTHVDFDFKNFHSYKKKGNKMLPYLRLLETVTNELANSTTNIWDPPLTHKLDIK